MVARLVSHRLQLERTRRFPGTQRRSFANSPHSAGVHLISFVLVAVNILWAEGDLLGIVATLQEKRVIRASPPFAAALFIIAICFALGWRHSQRHHGKAFEPRLTFACVQPNIPQDSLRRRVPTSTIATRKKAALEKAEDLSAQVLLKPDKPDLLIWPEAFTGQEIFDQRGLLGEIVREIATALPIAIFSSARRNPTPHHVYNTAYLFGPGWDTFQYYRKTRLVILGEYIPFGDTFPWLHRMIGVGMDMTPGPGPPRGSP